MSPMEVYVLTEDDHPIYTSYSYKDCVDYLLDMYYSKDEKPEYDYYAMTPVHSGNMTITHLGFLGDALYENVFFHVADRFPKAFFKMTEKKFETLILIDENTCMRISDHNPTISFGKVMDVSDVNLKNYEQMSGYESKEMSKRIIFMFDYHQGNRNDFTKDQVNFVKRLKAEFRHLEGK